MPNLTVTWQTNNGPKTGLFFACPCGNDKFFMGRNDDDPPGWSSICVGCGTRYLLKEVKPHECN